MADKKKKFRITRKMKKQIGLFLAFLILCFVIYGTFHKTQYEIEPSAFSEKYDAVYQHDGDTAVFYIEEEGNVICRFLAIDTPELGEEGYDEAKRFTDNTLEKASKIVLELDPNSQRYDKYDRLLAWVWVDGELLQAKLIENRLAVIRYIFHDYLYMDYLEKIEKSVTETESLTSR